MLPTSEERPKAALAFPDVLLKVAGSNPQEGQAELVKSTIELLVVDVIELMIWVQNSELELGTLIALVESAFAFFGPFQNHAAVNSRIWEEMHLVLENQWAAVLSCISPQCLPIIIQELDKTTNDPARYKAAFRGIRWVRLNSQSKKNAGNSVDFLKKIIPLTKKGTEKVLVIDILGYLLQTTDLTKSTELLELVELTTNYSVCSMSR